MSTKTNVLLTGATGFIGGTVFHRLVNHPDFNSSFILTVLVRSSDKAEKFRNHFRVGVNAVVGSYDDSALVESLAAQSDVVIATAHADHFEGALATLAGLKKRYQATGIVPVFIHTSGTGLLMDGATGEKATDDIYDDVSPAQLDALPSTALHRNVDVMLVDADKEGYVRTYIVIPPTIYGIVKGTLVDHGLQNRFSIQIPSLIRAALDRGRAGIVGEGKNIWNKVHVEDLADFYALLFDLIRKNPDVGHGHDGYYFVEAGEYIFYDVGKEIGEALVALGKLNNLEPTPFTKEEVDKYFGGSYYLGTNSRARATKARALGWKPSKTDDDFRASIRAEVEELAKARVA